MFLLIFQSANCFLLISCWNPYYLEKTTMKDAELIMVKVNGCPEEDPIKVRQIIDFLKTLYSNEFQFFLII